MDMCACRARYNFLNLGIRLDTVTLIACPTLIFLLHKDMISLIEMWHELMGEL